MRPVKHNELKNFVGYWSLSKWSFVENFTLIQYTMNQHHSQLDTVVYHLRRKWMGKTQIHSSLVFIFCGFTLIFRQIAKKNFLITIRKHFCSRDDSSNLCFNFRFLVQRFIWFYVLFFSYKIKMKKNMQTSYCYSCKLIYFFVKVRDHQKCIPAINRSQIELNKTLRKSPINNFKS